MKLVRSGRGQIKNKFMLQNSYPVGNGEPLKGFNQGATW